MGSICSNPCRRNQDLQKAQRSRAISSLFQITQFKQKKAIVNSKLISLPLSTDGAKIVDSFGRRVKLCCYNLKGCHSTKACISALEQNTLEDLAFEIKQNGFNSVIIPFSLDLYFENPKIQDICLGPNEWMKGKKALDILDITINSLTKSGLLVILRNACSKASYFKQFTESDGLWWSDKYPENKWLQCLKNLTSRYKHNARVIAIQLRHTLKSTPNYQPEWGTNNLRCDWKKAATTAGNQILQINPNILIFIIGDKKGDLRNIAESPIQLKIKNKVVFASKINKSHNSKKGDPSEDFKLYFEQNLNCIRKAGFPLILTAVTDRKESGWSLLTDFLQQSDLDWGYSSYPKSSSRGIYCLITNQKILPSLKRIQISTSGECFEQAYDQCLSEQQMPEKGSLDSLPYLTTNTSESKDSEIQAKLVLLI